MARQQRDDPAYTTLASRPDYGKDDFDAERKECNPIDLSKGTADNLQATVEKQIEGQD